MHEVNFYRPFLWYHWPLSVHGDDCTLMTVVPSLAPEFLFGDYSLYEHFSVVQVTLKPTGQQFILPL